MKSYSQTAALVWNRLGAKKISWSKHSKFTSKLHQVQTMTSTAGCMPNDSSSPGWTNGCIIFTVWSPTSGHYTSCHKIWSTYMYRFAIVRGGVWVGIIRQRKIKRRSKTLLSLLMAFLDISSHWPTHSQVHPSMIKHLPSNMTFLCTHLLTTFEKSSLSCEQQSQSGTTMTTMSYLAHIFSGACMEPYPQKLQAVYSWPTPQNAQEVHQFLGFASYYQHYIHCFADTAAHLHALTQQVVPFKNQKTVLFSWNQACIDTFSTLKSFWSRHQS